ncbi:MAG TPA: hypothetical protein VLA99_12450 [Nitrospiraceae bacterium]|nr:hypothetical protein [Nitrospiraceae bacterium]
MKRIVLFCVPLALAFSGEVGAIERYLKGEVLEVGKHNETTPVVGTEVTIKETGDTSRTKKKGLFRIFLKDAFKGGDQITLAVEKPGWVIQYPLDGETLIPSEPEKKLITVRLLPAGSPKLWTEDRIMKLIKDAGEKAKAQVKPEISKEKKEPVDFGRFIKDWANQYGFTAQQAKAEIDKWAEEVERKQEDFYKLGLAEYYNHNFQKAYELAHESGERHAKAYQQKTQEAEQYREQAIRDYQLAANAAYSDYRFDDALAASTKALDYVSKERSPRLWASVQNSIGITNWAIGVRIGGARSQDHLAKSVAAYKAALTVYTRELLPQDWAMTQNNLGTALNEQGIRTGGEEGRQLLAQAVAAYKAALEVRTREHLPEPWAQTQNNLAEAYLYLEEWAQAAESYRNVLTIYPDYEKAYQLANSLYHEKLFAHEKAFDLNQQWLARHPDDLSAQANFAEAYLATARFVEAETRLASLVSNPQLPPGTAAGLRALEMANLVALNKTDIIPSRLDALRSFIASQPETFTGEWGFEGTKHFISQHERFAKDRAWLLDLLTGLEGKKRDDMVAAINAAAEKVR